MIETVEGLADAIHDLSRFKNHGFMQAERIYEQYDITKENKIK
jgi:hypothetical protein